MVRFLIPVAWLAGIGGCRNGSVQQTPSSTPPPAVDSLMPMTKTVPPEASVAPVQSSERVTIDVAGTPIDVTLEDGHKLKAALMERLRENQKEDRDYLLQRTQNFPPSLEDGKLRIGVWTLMVNDGRLEFFHRDRLSLWSLPVAKEGGTWRVGPLGRGEIFPRR
jgi:hypothetical protein